MSMGAGGGRSVEVCTNRGGFDDVLVVFYDCVGYVGANERARLVYWVGAVRGCHMMRAGWILSGAGVWSAGLVRTACVQLS